MTSDATTAPRRRAWVWLAIVVAVAAGLRTRLLDVPLERDEGEYAYVGQQLRQGVPPYASAYTMKWPGTHVAYAAIMTVFGETPRGIHTGLIFINAASIVLVFLIGRRLYGDTAGVIASAAFVMLSISPNVEGFTANCEHFVLVPALAGMLLLLHAFTSGERISRRDADAIDGDQPPDAGSPAVSPSRITTFVFLSGLCFGLVPLFKQQGAMFSLFGGLYLLDCLRREQPIDWRRTSRMLASFCVAAAIPFLTTCAAMFVAGVFDTFWLWTVRYPRSYASQTQWSDVPGMLKLSGEPIVVNAWPLWSLAAAGLWGAIYHPALMARRTFSVGLSLFSFLAVCPGLFFRPHYFVYVLPVAALLIGGAVAHLFRPVAKWGIAVGAFLPLTIAIAHWNNPERWVRFATVPVHSLFQMTPAQITQQAFPLNPFAEAEEIAARIRELTPPGGHVAIIGSEPQLPFLARRRSATAHIYMYPLMEYHPFAKQMQSEMMAEVEAARPECLVFVTVLASWINRPFSRQLVFEWAEAYVGSNFEIDSVFDLQEAGPPQVYRSAEELRNLPAYDYRVKVFRRRAPPAEK